MGRNFTLGPMEILKTKGVTQLPTHGKRINVSIDPLDKSSQSDILAVPSYDYLEDGSKKVRIAQQNNSRDKVKLKRGKIVAKIMSANVVPPVLAPKINDINDEKDGPKPLSQRLTELFDKLDLSGISEWTQKN